MNLDISVGFLRSRAAFVLLACALLGPAASLAGDEPGNGHQWVASWAASAQGPYPSGNAVAQPVLTFAFPSAAVGANEQTFRLVVRPDLWGKRFRIRFTNVFGTQPVRIDDAYLGLQAKAGALVPGSNRPVTFGGRGGATIAAGQMLWSDPVELEYVNDAARYYLDGKKVAVSFHVAGQSGPMTWHAKALQTSYVTAPGAGTHGDEDGDASFPYSTASWYFVDALQVLAPADTAVVVALGDSITDGTGSTLNGDDRWPDVLSRRLHAAYGTRVAVVNEGIGGNQILGPAVYTPQAPFSGGPSALSRVERDVLSLGGVTHVVWLEGTNDLGAAAASSDAITAGMRQMIGLLHARGIRVIGATLPSTLDAIIASYGSAECDARRKAVNVWLRTSGAFDGIADFDAVTIDTATGEILPPYQPNSTTAVVDHIHPNRAGYLVMGGSVPIRLLAPPEHGRVEK